MRRSGQLLRLCLRGLSVAMPTKSIVARLPRQSLRASRWQKVAGPHPVDEAEDRQHCWFRFANIRCYGGGLPSSHAHERNAEEHLRPAIFQNYCSLQC